MKEETLISTCRSKLVRDGFMSKLACDIFLYSRFPTRVEDKCSINAEPEGQGIQSWCRIKLSFLEISVKVFLFLDVQFALLCHEIDVIFV